MKGKFDIWVTNLSQTVLLMKKPFRNSSETLKWPLGGDIYLKLFYSSWWLVGTTSQETRRGWAADLLVGQSYSLLWWAGRRSCHGNPEWSCHWLSVGLVCVHQWWGRSYGHLQTYPSLLWRNLEGNEASVFQLRVTDVKICIQYKIQEIMWRRKFYSVKWYYLKG